MSVDFLEGSSFSISELEEVLLDEQPPSDTMEVKELNQYLVLAKPKEKVQALLEAAVGPSIQRRSHACGALKVLTTHEIYKRILVRTKGFLDALVFVITAEILPNNDIDVAKDARCRAIECILNVAEPKGNRTILLPHPGLIDALVHCITDDNGEARAGACAALATIAKTVTCRTPMAEIDGLLDCLGSVLKAIPEDQDEDEDEIDDFMGDDEATEVAGCRSITSDTHGVRSVTSDTYCVKSVSTYTYYEGKSIGSQTYDYDDDDRRTVSSETYAEKSLSSYTYGENSLSTYTTYGGKSLATETYGGKSQSSETTTSTKSCSSCSSAAEEEAANELNVQSTKQKQIRLFEEIVERSRMNACAALLHLSKSSAVTPLMCENNDLMDAIVEVSLEVESPIHTKCLEFLCNLTRYPKNNIRMATYPGLVTSLVVNGRSDVDDDRLWSLRTLQNISSVKEGKYALSKPNVLELLSEKGILRKHEHSEEQECSIATLYNISTEPGAVVPLTNTKFVVATLIHVAHNSDSPSDVRLMSCDALATIGMWLQTLVDVQPLPDDTADISSELLSGWQMWD